MIPICLLLLSQCKGLKYSQEVGLPLCRPQLGSKSSTHCVTPFQTTVQLRNKDNTMSRVGKEQVSGRWILQVLHLGCSRSQSRSPGSGTKAVASWLFLPPPFPQIETIGPLQRCILYRTRSESASQGKTGSISMGVQL